MPNLIRVHFAQANAIDDPRHGTLLSQSHHLTYLTLVVGYQENEEFSIH